MSAPKSTLEWGSWARRQSSLQELSQGEAHLLLILASAGNQHGEGRRAVGELAAVMRRSERTVSRTLAELVGRHLVVRSGPRHGRLAWRLNASPEPVSQLTLAPEMADSLADSATPESATGDRGVRHSYGGQKDKGLNGGEGKPARTRADVPDHPALEPMLRQVLDVLHDAPGLLIEELAVNSALAAHPEPQHDHLRAAHTVASWAYEGGLNNGAANRLLLRALQRQAFAGGARPARSRRGGAAQPGEELSLLREMRQTMARARGDEVPA